MDRFLKNNTAVKGVALLLAVMLWMIVSLDDRPNSPVRQQIDKTTIDNVQVEAIYDEEMYAVMEMDDKVQVLLSGRRALLNLNMLTSNHRLYVDLTGLGEGEHQVKVQHDGFPSELQIDVLPSHIRVVIEEKEAEPFPVEVEVTGHAQEGYKVGLPEVSPDQVHVIAPSSVLDQVALVKGFVNVDQTNENITKNVNLKAYDIDGNVILGEVSPGVVEVKVPVVSPSKTVPLQVNMINQLPEGVSLVDIQNTVTQVEVFAPLDILEDVKGIKRTIDLSKFPTTREIQIELPLKEGWTKVEPSHVTAKVVVGPTREQPFYDLPVEVVGLQEGQKLEFNEPIEGQVDLTLLGSRERLDNVTRNKIQTFIDARNLSEGEHSLPVTIILPKYVRTSQEQINVIVYIRKE